MDDSYFIEKNMIAVEGRKNLFAYGDAAYDMYEKAPANIKVSFPVEFGEISDTDTLSSMNILMHNFINDLCGNRIRPCDYYVAVPCEITQVAKRAFYDLIRESEVKARKVWIVEKPIADGIGMGIDVKTSHGVLVVDVGYDTTEISLISLGGVVYSRLLKVGGHQFDEAIRNSVRGEDFKLSVGYKTAEKLKIAIRKVEEENINALVYGIDINAGLPVQREIPTSVVLKSLEPLYQLIVDNIVQVLEKAPPEFGKDIYRNGIYLSGGSSLVSHLAETISEATDLKVNMNEEPIGCVVTGLAEIIRNSRFQSLAYVIDSRRR